MAATEKAEPTDQEVADAYAAALKYAERRASRPDELAEFARDRATDAVLWAIRHYQAGHNGGFVSFAMSAVRRFVERGIKQSANRFHHRPAIVELTEGFPAPAVVSSANPVPESARELPAELRDTVRLFYVDRFDFRDIGLLMNCSMETVRCRLRKAGEILGDGLPKPVRMTGAKRMRH